MGTTSRVFAQPTTMVLGGRTFEVCGRVQTHYAEIEEEFVRRQPNPIAVAQQNMALFEGDPARQDRLLQLGMDKACKQEDARADEIMNWLGTLRGAAHYAWLTIRHNDAKLTPEDVLTLMVQDIDEAIAKYIKDDSTPVDGAQTKAENEILSKVHDAINKVSGTDLMGNGTGPTPTPVPGEDEKIPTGRSPEPPGTGPGGGSSKDSGKSTA